MDICILGSHLWGEKLLPIPQIRDTKLKNDNTDTKTMVYIIALT